MAIVAATSTLVPLKFVAALNCDSLPARTEPDSEIEYMDISGVDDWGRIRTRPILMSEAPSRARRLAKHGDTVISTVRTYLRAIAYIDEPPENLVISTGFAVLRPDESMVDPRFLFYAVQSERFLAEVIARSNGVSYPSIAPSRLGRIKVAIADRRQQTEVVDQLRKRLAKTDAIISANEQFVDMIKERRDAFNSSILLGHFKKETRRMLAVGNGLELPASWPVTRSKFLFREVDERSTTGEEMLLSVSYRFGVTPTAERPESEHRLEAESLVGYKKCQAGDLLLNRLMAFRGAVHVTPYDGVVSPEYLVLRAEPGTNADYLASVYRTPMYVAEFGRRSRGIGDRHFRLHLRDFGDIPVGLPTAADLTEITRQLAEVAKRHDLVATSAARMAKMVRERRTAIITHEIEENGK